MRGRPTIHSSASPIPSHACTRTSSPLYGRMSPKHRTTGTSTAASSAGSGSGSTCVRWSSTPCGMTSTRPGSMPTSPTSRRRPCSERTTTASMRPSSRACAATWPGRGSRGRTSWAVRTSGRRGEQALVDLPDGEPLEVHDVGGGRRAAVGEHVGDVRREARQPAQRAARRTGRPAVEALVEPVAVATWHLPVRERARHERDVRTRGGQRAAQRVVVGGRVRGGIDDVDAHPSAPLYERPASPSSMSIRATSPSRSV